MQTNIPNASNKMHTVATNPSIVFMNIRENSSSI